MTRPSPLPVDPSIRSCAHALVCEVIEDVGRWTSNGRPFFEARTRAIELRADEWVTRYGKETADLAVQAIHQLQPHEFQTKAERRRMLDREAGPAIARLARYSPRRNTWLNRFWIRRFGARLYALALLILIALAALPAASPASARGVEHQPSRWRLLALCGVAKPGPGRDRACARFDAGERTFRGYDAPTGSPRSWELPRTWEVER